jgi:hypothetical protein
LGGRPVRDDFVKPGDELNRADGRYLPVTLQSEHFMKLKIATAAALATLFAAPALAQSNWVEVDDQTIVAPFDAIADIVDDWDVYAPDGREIGDVEDVIGPDRNTATALVVDFDDNAGYGDRDDVVVPLDQFTWQDGRLVLNADPSAIAGMEVWDD